MQAASQTLCVDRLSALSAADVEVLVSNQVIGEAYVALQHHYGISKEDARAGLHTTLTSGLVAPLNGRAVLDTLTASGGPGLFDRLITNDYARAGMDTLTLDQRTASLPQARLVSNSVPVKPPLAPCHPEVPRWISTSSTCARRTPVRIERHRSPPRIESNLIPANATHIDSASWYVSQESTETCRSRLIQSMILWQ